MYDFTGFTYEPLKSTIFSQGFCASNGSIDIGRFKLWKQILDISARNFPRLFSMKCRLIHASARSCVFFCLNEPYQPEIQLVHKIAPNQVTCNGKSTRHSVTKNQHITAIWSRRLFSSPNETSSAVFHLASCDKRFWPAHTEVWMIFKKSCPNAS